MVKEKSLSLNSVFYLLYNALNVIFPFITGIYVAHILLPDAIGQVEAARNLAQYFVILSFLGIPTYGLREIAKARTDKDELNQLYSELIVINGISTLFFSLLYFILIASVPVYREEFFLYAITGIAIVLNLLNNSWLYEGLEEFKFTSVRNFIFKIVSFALLLLLVREKEDFFWYAAITVIGTAGNYLLNVIHSRKFVKFTFKGLNLKRHMKSIFFLVVVNLAIEIYTLVDVTMLGILSEDKNVAFYSYGQKIYRILLQVLNTFTMVLVPRISFYYKEQKFDEFNRLLTKTLKVILLLAVPVVVGIWFVSDYVICAIYGEAYISSAYVLKILSFILVISPVGYLLGSRIMLVTGHEKQMVIPVGVGAAVNIVCNAILIPLMQERGAAIASVVSELCVMAVYLLLGRKYRRLNYRSLSSSLWKEGAALLAMTAVLMGATFLPLGGLFVTAIQIVGAVGVYFLTLILTKEEIVASYFNQIISRFRRKNGA